MDQNNPKNELEGFSGWLALFAFGIMITPIVFIFQFITEQETYGAGGFTIGLYIILVLFAIWINYLMFKRKKVFKKWFVAFALFNMIITGLSVVGANTEAYLYTEEQMLDINISFWRDVFYGVIWTLYLWFSRRARNTFIE